jgi:two-component system sensor histidine kinase DesK
VWLVYLAYPAGAALRSPLPPWRTVALVGLALFAVVFLLAVSQARPARRGSAQARRRVATALVAMLVLLALAAPAARETAVGGLIYVGVLAVMTLPQRTALPLVALLAVVSEVVPRLVPGWSVDTFLGFQLIISCFAAWGVTQVISRNAELTQAREQIGRLAVADERARMARDLHDILGHSLTVITVKAELAGRLAEAEGATAAQAEIGAVEQLAREALADVRATIGGVRGVTLAGELAGARAALEAAGITAELPHAVEAVPPRWRELFAWTVREGVTNVVRHSGANHCVVRMTEDAVVVVDDGRGPAPARSSAAWDAVSSDSASGQGLAGLSERVAAAGGRLIVGAAEGAPGHRGFLLRVEVPS